MFKGREIVDKWKMVPFIKGISFFNLPIFSCPKPKTKEQ